MVLYVMSECNALFSSLRVSISSDCNSILKMESCVAQKSNGKIVDWSDVDCGANDCKIKATGEVVNVIKCTTFWFLLMLLLSSWSRSAKTYVSKCGESNAELTKNERFGFKIRSKWGSNSSDCNYHTIRCCGNIIRVFFACLCLIILFLSQCRCRRKKRP